MIRWSPKHLCCVGEYTVELWTGPEGQTLGVVLFRGRLQVGYDAGDPSMSVRFAYRDASHRDRCNRVLVFA